MVNPEQEQSSRHAVGQSQSSHQSAGSFSQTGRKCYLQKDYINAEENFRKALSQQGKAMTWISIMRWDWCSKQPEKAMKQLRCSKKYCRCSKAWKTNNAPACSNTSHTLKSIR